MPRGLPALRVGVHVSIAGGLTAAAERAQALGCQAMQIFSKSPRGWAARPLDPADAERAWRLREEHRLGPLAVHASYLLNLASPDPGLFERSMEGLIDELNRCAVMEADFLVIHVGCTRPEQRDGLTRVCRALHCVLGQPVRGRSKIETRILLENTAGERGEVGSRLEELAQILDTVRSDRLGVCLDTCHTLAAGYEYRTAAARAGLMSEIDRTVGIDTIKLIHLNDSKKGLGSHVDRHEHIGQGEVGPAGFRSLLAEPRLRAIPMVLETPKMTEKDDRRNLAAIRQLAATARAATAGGAARATGPEGRRPRRP